MNWFIYSGTNPSQPNSFTLSATEPTCTGLPEQMCALQAEPNINNRPIITEALKDEIINCLQNQVNDTNVKLKPR